MAITDRMTIAEQIAEYLQDQSIGTLATDLFVNFKPAQAPDDCIIVYDVSGPTEQEIPTSYPGFQIYVRNVENKLAYGQSMDIYDTLHALSNVTLVSGENFFYYIRASQTPGSIGHDDSDRSEFSINFQTYVRN
jgi:hypothetical protein